MRPRPLTKRRLLFNAPIAATDLFVLSLITLLINAEFDVGAERLPALRSDTAAAASAVAEAMRSGCRVELKLDGRVLLDNQPVPFESLPARIKQAKPGNTPILLAVETDAQDRLNKGVLQLQVNFTKAGLWERTQVLKRSPPADAADAKPSTAPERSEQQ